MSEEISGIVALAFQLDKAATALGTTDEALAPVQGAGSVAVLHAVQDGYIRGLDCELEAAQSDGDDVVFSVYIEGTRDAGSEVTVAGAGTSEGATYATARFERPDVPVFEGDSIVVKAKSTDSENTAPGGLVAIVYLQLGESGI
jgi:hypothetical protein